MRLNLESHSSNEFIGTEMEILSDEYEGQCDIIGVVCQQLRWQRFTLTTDSVCSSQTKRHRFRDKQQYNESNSDALTHFVVLMMCRFELFMDLSCCFSILCLFSSNFH